MQAIAREAGVVVQTIYSSVGSKRELLRRMNDLIDEEGGVAEFEQQIAAAREPREVLRLCVQLTRQIAEKCGDIIAAVDSAARSEPAMAEISEEGHRRHREGTRGVAEALARAGALPGGMSVRRAAQLLAVLTYNEAFFQLTRDHGMSFDEAEEWAFSALQTLLLAPVAELRGGQVPGPKVRSRIEC